MHGTSFTPLPASGKVTAALLHLKLHLLLALCFILSCSTLNAAPTHYGLEPDVELWEPPADAIHIDPGYSGNEDSDGSVERPFRSFHDSGFPWVDGGVYALKRGTTLSGPIVEIRSPGITIASYGDSPVRPKFYCTSQSAPGSNMHAFYTWDSTRADITIRDIEIEAPLASSCIRLMNAANTAGIKILNCKLHGSIWGLRILFTSSVLIENTEIYDTADDGMFIQGVTDLEIRNCYVHHVNTNWQPPSTPESEAAGDGIQLDASNHWHVHHNFIDRTSSGNKFCFISNNAEQDDGILEHNYMTGPLVDGLTVYMHNGDGIIVRYNIMKGPSSRPLYSHGTDIQIYGNIMSGIDGPIYASQSASIYNNVFYQMAGAIQGGTISAWNNIFVMNEGNDPFGWVSSLTQENNFFAGVPPPGERGGDPLFVNPAIDDFRLRPDSPCRDDGGASPMIQDIDGTSIPQANRQDIGAYESLPDGEI